MLNDESRDKRQFMRKRMMDDAGQLSPTRYIAKHTVTADETLSHIALEHYGHATKPYYTLIYEANKAAIGDDPNRLKTGLVLNIPELPAELKGE
jgi:nucleoid-associated protein YgaU